MELLNKYVDYLRKQYFENLKATVIKVIIALIALIAITCVFDFFAPFESFYNFIRAFIVAGGSVVVFSIGYLVTFFISQSNRQKDRDYTPIKERFSPSWRRRIGIIVAALLFGVIYSTSQTVVYSLVNSFVVATVIALVLFLSMTEEEVDREYYGVPDVRDNVYNENLKNTQKNREEKKELKEKKKKEKKRMRF